MPDEPLGDEGLDIGLHHTIRDEPGYRIDFDVEGAGDPQNVEFRLRVVDSITWWKSLSANNYFGGVGGGMVPWPLFRIETKDATKEADAFVQPFQMLKFGHVELWKGGFLGFGAWAQGWDINLWANQGRRFVFTWRED
jgi:hypothetical protein